MIYRDSKGRFCKKEYAVNTVVKGYKGFKQGLICRGKQYKVGEVFTEPEAIPCKSGIHFCKNPLDVPKFYPPVDSIGIPNEYAEVEALEEPVTDDGIKFCTTKLRIVRKLSLTDFIQAGVAHALEHNQNVEKATGVSSIASNTGNCSIASNTDYYSIVSNTDNCSIASNTGDQSIVSNTGNCSIASNTGDCSVASNTGYLSIVSNTGYRGIAFNNGECSTASVSGNRSIAVNTGYKGKVKGALGCWIVCAEWRKGEIVDVQTRYVDGKEIKADTWYRLEDGNFVEVN